APLGIVGGGGGVHGLEGHAADGAVSGSVLADLRVHGAGAGYAVGGGGGPACERMVAMQEGFGIGLESLGAARGAEEVSFARVRDGRGLVPWLDGHAADGIARDELFR